MRLNEIENPNIKELLRKRFVITGRISIQDNVVGIIGNCRLKPTPIQHQWDTLPITFSTVSGDFECGDEELLTLKGCPSYVGGQFWCAGNELKNLIGGPEYATDYNCSRNSNMHSLKGVAKTIENNFECTECNLTTLEYLPESVGNIIMSYDYRLPLLKLLSIKNLKYIAFYPVSNRSDQVRDILNKYIGKGRGGILSAAAHLTKIGCKGNAQL